MGLYIMAASRISKVDCNPQECAEDHLRVFVNPEFPEQADGLADGCYEIGGDDKWFAAGSYSSYSRWRERLASLIGATPQSVWDGQHEGAAFVELVNFSDCEGVIGPRTSAKLAADFRAHEDAARAVFDDREFQKYREWMHAFELAADAGAVTFH